MERVKYNRVEVNHGNMAKKFPVYEIYLDGVIVTKVSSENEALFTNNSKSKWHVHFDMYMPFFITFSSFLTPIKPRGISEV